MLTNRSAPHARVTPVLTVADVRSAGTAYAGGGTLAPGDAEGRRRRTRGRDCPGTGARLVDPPHDCEYGERQATIDDPFGHQGTTVFPPHCSGATSVSVWLRSQGAHPSCVEVGEELAEGHRDHHRRAAAAGLGQLLGWERLDQLGERDPVADGGGRDSSFEASFKSERASPRTCRRWARQGDRTGGWARSGTASQSTT